MGRSRTASASCPRTRDCSTSSLGLLEQQGDYRAAIEHGERALRLDPLDERMYRWLMRLHALNQDRAGALRVYQDGA